MKTLHCTCCHAEITAPQFHNGKAYGWTCIKKVSPAAKPSKAKFFAVELLASRPSALRSADGTQGQAMTFRYNGKRYIAHVAASQTTEQYGITFISEHVLAKLK